MKRILALAVLLVASPFVAAAGARQTSQKRPVETFFMSGIA